MSILIPARDPAIPAATPPIPARDPTGSPSRRAPAPSPQRVTTTLNANELLAVPAPEGKPRITLRIRLPDHTVIADIAAKSLRKAQAAIRDAGADNIVLVLQGRLIAGAVIAEAGLSAQPKAAKPAQQRPAAGNDHGVGA